jgi:hypothetical protein
MNPTNMRPADSLLSVAVMNTNLPPDSPLLAEPAASLVPDDFVPRVGPSIPEPDGLPPVTYTIDGPLWLSFDGIELDKMISSLRTAGRYAQPHHSFVVRIPYLAFLQDMKPDALAGLSEGAQADRQAAIAHMIKNQGRLEMFHWWVIQGNTFVLGILKRFRDHRKHLTDAEKANAEAGYKEANPPRPGTTAIYFWEKNWFCVRTQLTDFTSEYSQREIAKQAGTVTDALIALLATRNVEKLEVVKRSNVQRFGVSMPRAPSADEPREVLLHCPHPVDERREGAHLGGHHRSPRLHFRSGHYREQAIGAGRLEHKTIWIEPMIVMADAETATAYKLTGKLEPVT